jgi:hypothetical protein
MASIFRFEEKKTKQETSKENFILISYLAFSSNLKIEAT